MAEKDSCADGGPAELTQVLAYVEGQRQAFIERLLAYVARPSISAHGVGIEETAEFLLDYLQGLGMETQLLASRG